MCEPMSAPPHAAASDVEVQMVLQRLSVREPCQTSQEQGRY